MYWLAYAVARYKRALTRSGIKFLRLFEIFDRRVKLRVLERRNTFVQKIAGTELVASGNAGDEREQHRHAKHLTGRSGDPRGRPPSNRYLSHGSFHP